MGDKTTSAEKYIQDVVLWFYEAKKTADNVKKSFEETKYEFSVVMEEYFDRMAEDNKLSVECEGRYSGVKKVIITKVVPTKVLWDLKLLKKLLSKKERKLVIKKNYTINDWHGLFKFLKDSGVDYDEFIKFVSVTEEVREKELDKLVDLGMVDEEEVKACCSIKLSRPQFRVTEK